MSLIVGIHGIGAQQTSGPQMTGGWWRAIRGGLEAAGMRPQADALLESDVRVAFYGSLFRPPGSLGVLDSAKVSDLDEVDVELLAALAEVAETKEPELAPPDGHLGPIGRGINANISTLLKSRTFSSVVKGLLLGSFRQVNRFLDDPAVKELAIDRVREEVSSDTRVLIGHSLGSIVAYEYLCADQPQSIELFVTIGSPLGLPQLIYDRLTPHPVAGHGAWPASVPHWTNVADDSDIVAATPRLAPLFEPPKGTPPLTDRIVENGGKPHAALRYLNSQQVGKAVGSVLL